jgi:hypothetical protein
MGGDAWTPEDLALPPIGTDERPFVPFKIKGSGFTPAPPPTNAAIFD